MGRNHRRKRTGGTPPPVRPNQAEHHVQSDANPTLGGSGFTGPSGTSVPPPIPSIQAQSSAASTLPSDKVTWKDLKLTLIGGFILLFFDKGVDFLRSEQPQAVVPQTVVPVTPAGDQAGPPFQLLVPVNVQVDTQQPADVPVGQAAGPTQQHNRTFIDAAVPAQPSSEIQSQKADVVIWYDSLLFSPDSAGIYRDTVNGIQYTVYPMPSACFNPTPDSVCVGQPISFINCSVGLADSLIWFFDDSIRFHIDSTNWVPGTYYTLHFDPLVGPASCPDTMLAGTWQPPALMWQFNSSSCGAPILLDSSSWSLPATEFGNPGVYHVTLANEHDTTCIDSVITSICVDPWSHILHTFDTTFNIALYATNGCGYDTATMSITVFPQHRLARSNKGGGLLQTVQSDSAATQSRQNENVPRKAPITVDRSMLSRQHLQKPGQWTDWLKPFLIYTALSWVLVISYRHRRLLLFMRSSER